LAEPRDFLARWSRLKRKARAEPRSEVGRQPAILEASPREPASAPAAPTPATPELPPLESLGKDSDYTPFMRADVPDALRNEALQRLWRSDPVFANLDGLLEYGEDFGAAFKAGGVVATVYRVLEGMPGLGPDEPRAQAKEGAATPPAGAAEAPPEPPPSEQPVAAEAAPVTADGRRDEVGLE
jgi:Protein of unknown function (DUF3306)